MSQDQELHHCTGACPTAGWGHGAPFYQCVETVLGEFIFSSEETMITVPHCPYCGAKAKKPPIWEEMKK